MGFEFEWNLMLYHSNFWSRIAESSDKNAFLKVRLNLRAMGLSDESEWKVRNSKIINVKCLFLQIYISQEKLKEEEKLRTKLEETLLELQWKMSKYKTEL
jgi:hypothetical protein